MRCEDADEEWEHGAESGRGECVPGRAAVLRRAHSRTDSGAAAACVCLTGRDVYSHAREIAREISILTDER